MSISRLVDNFSGIFMDSEGVLVKPEAAKRQLEEEEKERQRKRETEGILPPSGGRWKNCRSGRRRKRSRCYRRWY